MNGKESIRITNLQVLFLQFLSQLRLPSESEIRNIQLKQIKREIINSELEARKKQEAEDRLVRNTLRSNTHL